MDIIIKETGETQTLSLTDASSGTDYIQDFVGNLCLRQETIFGKEDTLILPQKKFDWLSELVEEQQALNNRAFELVQKHGLEVVNKAIHPVVGSDIKDLIRDVNDALDEAFGCLRHD
jgi:hypothetical protein